MRAFAVWLTAIFMCSAAQAATEGCVINGLQGDAMVVREGQEMPVKEGDVLQKGDRLKTSPTCQVDMSMNDLAGCRVLSGSEVEVVGWKPENMTLKVEKGNVILNLTDLPKESSFKVQTPTAVATVRGTQFWGRVNPAADALVTTFAVRKGEVSILPAGSEEPQAILLTPGQAIDISSAGGTTVTREALAEEMAAMEQADQIPYAA